MTIAVIVVVVVALVAGGIVLARRGAGRVRQRVDDRLAALTVERQARANFYGVASAGTTQVRGLGVLALTPDELVFLQFVPDKEVRVARTDIRDVATARSYLGKTQARDLLVVTWGDDEAAWDVDDVDAWVGALRPADPAT